MNCEKESQKQRLKSPKSAKLKHRKIEKFEIQLNKQRSSQFSKEKADSLSNSPKGTPKNNGANSSHAKKITGFKQMI